MSQEERSRNYTDIIGRLALIIFPKGVGSEHGVDPFVWGPNSAKTQTVKCWGGYPKPPNPPMQLKWLCRF